MGFRGKMTPLEAAMRTGKSPEMVRYYIRTGRIAATQIAGRWLIDPSEVAKLAEAEANG